MESSTKSDIIGIDLAKNSFSICVMNGEGRVKRRLKRVRRDQVVEKVVNECGRGIVAMEACSGAHYWSRKFQELGYETRIIPAQYVKPYVKSNKNDELDAEAICEACSRKQMRFVRTKSEEQLDIQAVHRVRERLVKSRTALCNEIRGFLSEYGIILPQGVVQVRRELPGLIERESERRSILWKQTNEALYQELVRVDENIERCDEQIKQIAKENETCSRLLSVPGIGPVTATALYAAVGDGHQFKDGRDLAAWTGVTPKQYTTGGKIRLGGISKRGDSYLRKLLVQGARALAIAAQMKLRRAKGNKSVLNEMEVWFLEVAQRRGGNKAVIALANKIARMSLHVLKGAEYVPLEERRKEWKEAA